MATKGATVKALESLYRVGLAHYVRAAAAITGDEATARDAVQEAFVQAVRHRASFRGEASLDAWVWRIVINETLVLRRRRVFELERGAAFAEPLSNNHVPDHDARVRAWVAALPERQRLAVFLRYFADLDYRSIAAALEVEVGTRLGNPRRSTHGAPTHLRGGRP